MNYTPVKFIKELHSTRLVALKFNIYGLENREKWEAEVMNLVEQRQETDHEGHWHNRSVVKQAGTS